MPEKIKMGSVFAEVGTKVGTIGEEKNLETVMVSRFFMVAGEGFEPPTSGL